MRQVPTGLMAMGFLVLAFPARIDAQQSSGAAANDGTAQAMIALERQWAEEACSHKMIVDTLLADDFQGTSPDGKRYAKAQAIEEAKSSQIQARGCKLGHTAVHFFGDTVAVVYGNESSLLKTDSGAEESKCLVWTDTWIKRQDKWQIVAAQDTRVGCK